MVRLCAICGGHLRSPKNRNKALRARECPLVGMIHHKCCDAAPCSERASDGSLRCPYKGAGSDPPGLPGPTPDPGSDGARPK